MSNIKLLTTEERNRFIYHRPDAHAAICHDSARAILGQAAADLTDFVPDGRHRSLMLTALQEAMMWANAGIACDGSEPGAAVQA